MLVNTLDTYVKAPTSISRLLSLIIPAKATYTLDKRKWYSSCYYVEQLHIYYVSNIWCELGKQAANATLNDMQERDKHSDKSKSLWESEIEEIIRLGRVAEVLG